MKTFRVVASYTTYVYVDVEAENEDQAFEIAEDMDGGEFQPLHGDDMSDWTINEAEEVTT